MVPSARMADEDAVDAALVAAMARGEPSALAKLYERHSGVLLAVAVRIVRERREAEDLLHDVFLEAWKAAKDFDPKRGRVRTWLAIRMRSRALDLKKSARVSRNAGDSGIDLIADEGERGSPDHVRVRAAIQVLGGDQRKVLELAYFEGLSCTEISDRITIPVGTVKSRLAAALGKLREALMGKS
jgi:RNA polymerase sigma-70 factor, ECF subfamily